MIVQTKLNIFVEIAKEILEGGGGGGGGKA